MWLLIIVTLVTGTDGGASSSVTTLQFSTQGNCYAAAKALALYRQYARDAFDERDLRACLRGKNLACWCPIGQPCHADVLVEMANPA